MAQPERIVELTHHVRKIAEEKISLINHITREVKILAINAMVESSRAGQAGASFGVVASHVQDISEQITQVAADLSTELTGSIHELNGLGEKMIRHVRGQRLADLALNMIEIIDRNLYERSCDVRWWATDSAVVDALQSSNQQTARHVSERLAVILGSYTVYLDIWVADANGRVVANGRPERYPGAVGSSVAQAPWFQSAMGTRTGDDYVATDIETVPLLGDRQVATYATAVRQKGESRGKPIGALGIFFDWEPQAAAVVKGVRLGDDEKAQTRCLLIDAKHRVIASSDGQGILGETVHLKENAGANGYYVSGDGHSMIGYSLTPGYETYKGMGWYGVMIQQIPKISR